MIVLRRVLAGLALSLAAIQVADADDRIDPDTGIWRKVRAELFDDRPIADDAGTIDLRMPARAEDAAVVPLAIRVKPSPASSPVRKLYLVIDRNPSPIAAIFEFGPASAAVEVQTRVRIEEYTWVRVIAEGADGSLRIAQHFIKAAGGCSAPAGKSLADRLAGLGQMRWRIDSSADPEMPASVQLMIRHPNNSGLAMDQLTRLYDPPFYVRHVRVTRGDELAFSADVDFSISENPSFRFAVRQGAEVLHATVTDSNGQVFESAAPAGTEGPESEAPR
jgi:sulfur-oxidizing protein SoxY